MRNAIRCDKSVFFLHDIPKNCVGNFSIFFASHSEFLLHRSLKVFTNELQEQLGHQNVCKTNLALLIKQIKTKVLSKIHVAMVLRINTEKIRIGVRKRIHIYGRRNEALSQ